MQKFDSYYNKPIGRLHENGKSDFIALFSYKLSIKKPFIWSNADQLTSLEINSLIFS